MTNNNESRVTNHESRITIEEFIQATTQQVKPLYKAYTLAEWETATTGTPEANQRNREAQAAYMRFWADAERYTTAKRFYESGEVKDPLVARQIKLLYLATTQNRQDEATIEKLTRLEAEVREQYYNFRAEVGGKKLSDNELEEILSKSRNSAEIRETDR